MKLSEQMRETAKAAEGIGKHDTAGRWHQYADNAAALEAEAAHYKRALEWICRGVVKGEVMDCPHEDTEGAWEREGGCDKVCAIVCIGDVWECFVNQALSMTEEAAE